MRSLFRFLVAAACAVPVLAADEGIVFEQHYKVGHRYHQTVSTVQEMNMDLGIEKTEQKMTMTLGMSATVSEIPGSAGKRVTIAYDHAAMTQSAGGQKFSFDSKEPDAANAGPLAALGGIVGREFKVIFDSEGNVKDVEDFEATIQKMSGGNAETAKLYAQLFSKDTVKRMMQQSALRSPAGKPVKIGEAWPFTNELEMPGVGKLVVRGFYTYKGLMDVDGTKLAQVQAKADIRVEMGNVGNGDGDKTGNLLDQMKMKIEEGRMEGTLLYDPAISFTTDVQLTQSITLTAEIPDGTRKTLRLPMKQNIHMQLDQFEKVKKADEEK